MTKQEFENLKVGDTVYSIPFSGRLVRKPHVCKGEIIAVKDGRVDYSWWLTSRNCNERFTEEGSYYPTVFMTEIEAYKHLVKLLLKDIRELEDTVTYYRKYPLT